MEVNAVINVYDSEIDAIGKVVAKLNERTGPRIDLEGFRKEAIERFAEIGLVVEMLVYTAQDERGQEIPDLYPMDISIIGRCEPLKDGFDNDRLRHEIVGNLLNMPGEEAGRTIPFSPSMLETKGHHH